MKTYGTTAIGTKTGPISGPEKLGWQRWLGCELASDGNHQACRCAIANVANNWCLYVVLVMRQSARLIFLFF
ncbi:hypothetical protein RvY_14121 [Ramazzottius varieornatus]|uniref:Uncharacterized protein n=1 Tax=Ramazzottius varieornatus TaxID=947166 RepID=A0A1D1VS94_RAMVA|nr:hypothetical protein RvY_14121 [Ramazzottius varieornatus]